MDQHSLRKGRIGRSSSFREVVVDKCPKVTTIVNSNLVIVCFISLACLISLLLDSTHIRFWITAAPTFIALSSSPTFNLRPFVALTVSASLVGGATWLVFDTRCASQGCGISVVLEFIVFLILLWGNAGLMYIQHCVVKAHIDKINAMMHELNVAKDVAESGVRAKDFLNTMSHELRTPLHGLLGMIDEIQATDHSPVQKEILATMKQCGDLLLSLVNNVLDLSRFEAGLFTLASGNVELPALLRGVLGIVSGLAEKKGLTLDFCIDPSVPMAIFSDGDRLQQVLINLTANAVKFTKEGGIMITVKMMVVSPGSPPLLVFTVTDTGSGILQEHQALVFDAFTQVKSVVLSGGSGLGLNICKRIVTLMGGEIGIRSVFGKGSEFWFTIPLFEAHDELAALPPTQPESPEETQVRRRKSSSPEVMHKEVKMLRLLVVDDNSLNLRVAIKALERQGFTNIDTACDGQQVLDLVLDGNEDLEDPIIYDLILMDVQMPVMGGIECTRVLREMETKANQHPTFIAGLSAHAIGTEKLCCLEAGMDHFLTKPFKLADLQAVTKLAYLHKMRHRQQPMQSP